MSPVPEDETLAVPLSPVPNSRGNMGVEWWSQGPDGSESAELGSRDKDCEGKTSWTAVTLCFLSRWPHVQQLQQCLHYLYSTCILSSLERWETHCDQLIANHRENITANSHLNGGRGGGASCLVLEPIRLGLQCVDLLTMLCLESPVPLWGVFTLNIVLPAQPLSNSIPAPLADKRGVSPKASTEMSSKSAAVKFAQCPPEDLPLCPYSLCDSIFRCLGPKGVLTVLSAALAESRILFFSSDASLLPAVCESLRTLLYPMKWAHVYLPVVPAPLLDLVQAPVPYILGTLSKWMALIPPEFLCDVVLVDLDTGAIDAMRSKEAYGGSSKAALLDMVPAFPPKIERWLLCALKEVVAPNADLAEFTLLSSSSVPVPVQVQVPSDCTTPSRIREKDTVIQLIVFDVMANLLRYVPGCIFSLNVGECEGPSHHVFNRPLFLSDCIEDDNRPFLTMLTDTNAFEQFTESLYSPSMGFYLRSLGSLPTPVMSLKTSGTQLAPTGGAQRKNSRQTHRDVLPLPGNDSTATVVDKSCSEFSFPNSVINGGDRLNVVKLPNVSVTPEAVIVTAPSSPSVSPCSSRRNSINSIKGMLLFPASTTSTVQLPDTPEGLDLYLARTGSCDSILTRSTDSLTGGSTSKATGSPTKDRSDKGRLLSLFPDWIVALMHNQNDGSCPSNVTKRTFIEPIIDFYAPLVMCAREQRCRDDLVNTGVIYEGYQPGNVIAAHSSMQGLTPFPVLTLTVSPSKIRETRLSSYENEVAASLFAADTEEWDSAKLSSKSPRLKALRSGSDLERELSTDESKSILRGGDMRSMVPLSSIRSVSSESRPMSLNLSKTKRTRPFSVNIRPQSVNLSARTSTGDSMNAMSPSYLSFLPLIGKTSGLAVFSEGGMTADGESDTSTPTSPNRSTSGPYPTDLDMSPSAFSLAFQLENEAVMRRRSYGRIRSSTFGQYSARKGGSKHARRRHSADSCYNNALASNAPTTSSSDYLPDGFVSPSHGDRPDSLSDSSGSGSPNPAESRMDTVSSINTISSFNLMNPLSNPTLQHPEREGSDKVPSPVSLCLCPPLIFDTEALEVAVGQIEEWTVGELAGALKQPLKAFLKNLKGEAERSTDPFSPWSSNNSTTTPVESARSSLNTRSPSKRWPNRAAVGIGGAITDYLQFAFSGVSMSPRQVEHLERRCVGALELHDNRMRLVHLLRQTNKGTPSMPPNSPAIVKQGLQLLTHPHSRAADLESQLFPLHTSTFELLSKLYSLAVEACVTYRDYLAAYGLLGVGGLYFQIQSRPRTEHSRDRHDEEGDYDLAQETEFLCERISQHPIFQSPYLWMTVMRSKLSIYNKRGPSTSPAMTSPTERREEGRSEPEGVECDVDALFLEAYALLFIINRLGVNYERAAAFNKMVVSDYSLAKGHYLQLQQYTDELYSPQVSCLNQANRQYSREAASFRSRSRSDPPHILRLAYPQKLKLKARNFSPQSHKEGTLIFHNESSLCWDGDGDGDGGADQGARFMGPLNTTDEGTCAVLADLTTLVPFAPPACADFGGTTTPPLTWSASMRSSISPTNASKDKPHSAPFLRSLIRSTKEPVEVAACSIKGYGYAPHPRSEEATRGRSRAKRSNTETKAPPSEVISPTRRKASVIATRLKSFFMRKSSATTPDTAKDAEGDDGDKDGSLTTLKITCESKPHDDQNNGSTIHGHSNTPEKSKGMKCIELNQQNYYSIPLEVRLALSCHAVPCLELRAQSLSLSP